MRNTSTKYKSIKISNADYIILLSLKHYTFQKRKLNISQKNILGWALRKAYDDFLKYEESQNSK
jgi:hypothetical protein